MARRNQSDAEGWAPPGGPWPVAQDERWAAEQNRRLPPEPGGLPPARGIQAPTSQDLHWQPVDQAPAVDPWDALLGNPSPDWETMSNPPPARPVSDDSHLDGRIPRTPAPERRVNGQAPARDPRLAAPAPEGGYTNGHAVSPAAGAEYPTSRTLRLPAETDRPHGHAPRLPATPSPAGYANGRSRPESDVRSGSGQAVRPPGPAPNGDYGQPLRLPPPDREYTNGHPARLPSPDRGYPNGHPVRLPASAPDRNYVNGQPGRLPAPDRDHSNGQPARLPAPDRDHSNGQPARLPAPDRGYANGYQARLPVPDLDYDAPQTHRLPAAVVEPAPDIGRQAYRSTPAIEKVYDTGQSRRISVPMPEESYDSHETYDGQESHGGQESYAVAEDDTPDEAYDTGATRRVAPVSEKLYDTGRSRRGAIAEDEAYDTGAVRRRAPAPESEDDSYESGRRRSGRLRVEVPPIVNPYSIVALVGALLGLFPVAIVFGLISFGHPRGRIMALFALMMGVVEVTAVAGLLMLSGFTLPHNPFHLQAASSQTQSETVAPTAQGGAMTPTTAQATAAPTTTTAASSTAPVGVVQGQPCTAAQAALIGTAADSSTLLCLQGTGGYRWTGPYNVNTAVYTTGSSCNPASDKSARTADGRALVCQGTGRSAAWTPWMSTS